MKQEIELYINKMKVDFDEKSTNILFNYKETDLHNPTSVKNSFSKTVNLPGTKNNKDIFGHLWNLEKCQLGYGFDALRKTDFQLFLNGDKYEEGYCKLESIKTKGGETTFSVVLYGGIGDFIYNLTYLSDNSDVKKTLADLNYGNTQSLDFTINKEAVRDAWSTLLNGKPTIDDDRWEFINFAVTSNGIPSDFEANKVLINTKNFPTTTFPQSKSDGGVTYRTLNGFAMAETSAEMTSDETFDLRSYLLTPVVNMRKVIDACCLPENNGGYEVDLDNGVDGFFFENPYYNNSWLTLRKLKDLELTKATSETITDGELVQISGGYDIDFDSTLSVYNSAELTVTINWTPNGTMPTDQYLYTHFQYNCTRRPISFDNGWVKDLEHNTGVILQLLAKDDFGNIVGRSNPVLCASRRDYGTYKTTNMDANYEGSSFYPVKFKKGNGKYYMVGYYTNEPLAVKFTLPSNLEYTHLVLYQMCMSGRRRHLNGYGDSTLTGPDSSFSSEYLWNREYIETTAHNEENSVLGSYAELGHFSAELIDMKVSKTAYESLFTNTEIPASKLLATQKSPADYLLSYCKLFGLYIWSDPSEESYDKERFPKGVIHIDSRNAFYKRDIINDIEKSIDLSKDLSITPVTAKSRWYDFDVEEVDGDAAGKYKNTYGYTYGRQLVNTGYNFDTDTTSLYDGNAFKSAVMVQEQDKYFSLPTSNVPVYVWNGFKYYLFHKDGDKDDYDTYEEEYAVKKLENVPINFEDLPYYDCFEKCQLHSKDNEATDGEDVLLFFDQFMSTNVTYWITDDLQEMGAVNDGSPCWILTKSETDSNNHTIAIATNNLPLFTRTLYGASHKYQTHTWDFGNPQVTFVPESYNTDEMGLYAKYWKTYIEDMYDQDNRILTCYVRPDRRWGIQSMREFYWFNNSIWRLNSIKDYDASSSESIKMEFIKVKDVENYKNIVVTQGSLIYAVWDVATMPATGGTLTGYVYSQGGDSWTVADNYSYTDSNGGSASYDSQGRISPLSGNTQRVAISVNITANNTPYERTWEIGVIDGYDNWYHFTIVQEGSTRGSIEIAQRTFSVSMEQQSISTTYTAINIVGDVTISKTDHNHLIDYFECEDGRIYAELSANESSFPRSATLTLSGVDGQGNIITNTVNITQEGSWLDIIPEHLEFDYFSTSEKTFNVYTDGDFTITQIDNGD